MNLLFAGLAPAHEADHFQKDFTAQGIACPIARVGQRGAYRLFFYASGRNLNIRENHGTTIVMKGQTVATGTADRDSDDNHYEGCFTSFRVDAAGARLIVFRNIFGTGYTYYWHDGQCVLVATNLAVLARVLGERVRVATSVLPTFFLYRTVPGKHTLFQGISRLLPGEMLVAERGDVRVLQKRRVADYYHDQPTMTLEPIEKAIRAIVTRAGVGNERLANLFSGGVDSSYLQVVANTSPVAERVVPFTIHVDHEGTFPHTRNALRAATHLGVQTRLFPISGSYAHLFLKAIATTAEPPNHVQTAYFQGLAAHLRAQGIETALCGQGADGLFGIALANRLQCANLMRSIVRPRCVRKLFEGFFDLVHWQSMRDVLWIAEHLSEIEHRFHPLNRVGVFTDWDALDACFGRRAVDDALLARQGALQTHGIKDDNIVRLHFNDLFSDALDTAGLWSTLFDTQGVDLLFPFLDSRVLSAAVNLPPRVLYRFRQPKSVLKHTLKRYAPDFDVHQPKMGFGQPIFEWLSEGGRLRPWVDAMADYDFVEPAVLKRCKAKPNWFLFSLLCYDIWHKLFIKRSMSVDDLEDHLPPRRERETCAPFPA